MVGGGTFRDSLASKVLDNYLSALSLSLPPLARQVGHLQSLVGYLFGYARG